MRSTARNAYAAVARRYPRVKVDGDCRLLHLNRGFPGECVYDVSAVRQRGLDVAIAEINKEIDLRIKLETVERLSYRVEAINFSIKTQAVPKAGRSMS